jgi:hypothetical protein
MLDYKINNNGFIAMSLYQLAHVIVEQMDMCFLFGFPSLIPNLDNLCANFWLSILHYRTLMKKKFFL